MLLLLIIIDSLNLSITSATGIVVDLVYSPKHDITNFLMLMVFQKIVCDEVHRHTLVLSLGSILALRYHSTKLQEMQAISFSIYIFDRSK